MDDARFESILKEITKTMPDEESVTNVTKGLRNTWDKPALKELEMVGGRTYNLQQTRQLLFVPEPVDMATYVGLVCPAPKGSPPEHPQHKVQTQFLALLYMRHAAIWPLMREFIREGGLVALSESFMHENTYLRAQAVDVFMQLTSTDLHDWFNEPSPLEPAVHKRFLDLAGHGPNFVAKLEANMGDKEPFPGGSYYCLQILAFWLSLLRFFYCEQRVMRLGTHLMDVLKRWAALPDRPEPESILAQQLVDDFSRFPTVDSMAGQLVGASGTGLTKEQEAAAFAEVGSADDAPIILEDDEVAQPAAGTLVGGKAGAAANGSAPTPASKPPTEPSKAMAVDEDDTRQIRHVAVPLPAGPPKAPTPAAKAAATPKAPTPAATPAADDEPLLVSAAEARAVDAAEATATPSAKAARASRTASLKQLGNAAFGKGEHAAAIGHYTEALALGADASEKHPIHGNRSAARLKLAAAAAAEGRVEASTEYANLAIDDAKESLRLEPMFIKGYYRHAAALSHLERSAEAVAVLEKGLASSPHNNELRAALSEGRQAMEAERRAALKKAKQSAADDDVAAAPAKAPTPTVDYEAAAAAAAKASALASERRAAANGAADAAAADGGRLLPMATSVQQFDRVWGELRAAGASLGAQRAWLMQLPAADYPALFKESLSEATLLSVLGCLLASATAADVGSDDAAACVAATTQALTGLSSTRRFSMLLMFLDDKQKKVIKGVFGEMRRLGEAMPPSLAKAWEQK